MAIKVAINGFGRIGRLVFRLIQEHHPDIDVVAINDLVPADNLAYLVRYDTVHRRPSFEVEAKGDAIVVGDRVTQVCSHTDPLQLPWKALGVHYVIESTGRFTHLADAEKHLQAGAERVILSAPAKENVPTFVMGVNHERYCSKTDRVVSNASCTTNCLAPLVKVLLDTFGIEEGLMTTIHSLTASQPSVDGPSKKDWRGGRAASVNIIPASTGAAKAVSQCLPEVKGKLTGMAFRVPTLDVSAVDLTVKLSKETSYEGICEAMRQAAENKLKNILEYCDEEVVSSDFIGHPASCIFDAKAGIALNSRFYKLIAWYDNEVGYACRLIDLLRYMASKDKF